MPDNGNVNGEAFPLLVTGDIPKLVKPKLR
jgi:hypothetical protein